MENDKDNMTPSPFSLRLTFEERAQLERDAEGQPLGSYIRDCILDPKTARLHKRRGPVKDRKALASVLAMLGQSRLANNLNQLAHAADTGSLAMTPNTEAALKGACRDIASIRHMLMVALGLADGNGGKSESTSLHMQFASSSSDAAAKSGSPPSAHGRYRPPRAKPKSPAL